MAYDVTTIGMGKNLYIKFGTKGAEVALNDNGYITKVTWPADIQAVDASGSGGYEASKAGQYKVSEITVEALVTSGAAGIANPVATFAAVMGVEGKGFWMCPAGNTTGFPKRFFDTNDGSCWVKSIDYGAADAKNVIKATIKLQTTGGSTITAV